MSSAEEKEVPSDEYFIGLINNDLFRLLQKIVEIYRPQKLARLLIFRIIWKTEYSKVGAHKKLCVERRYMCIRCGRRPPGYFKMAPKKWVPVGYEGIIIRRQA